MRATGQEHEAEDKQNCDHARCSRCHPLATHSVRGWCGGWGGERGRRRGRGCRLCATVLLPSSAIRRMGCLFLNPTPYICTHACARHKFPIPGQQEHPRRADKSSRSPQRPVPAVACSDTRRHNTSTVRRIVLALALALALSRSRLAPSFNISLSLALSAGGTLAF
jgi:hypothetical protein